MCICNCEWCYAYDGQESATNYTVVEMTLYIEAYRWNLRTVNVRRRPGRLFSTDNIFTSASENRVVNIRAQTASACGIIATNNNGQTPIMVVAEHGLTRFLKKVFYHYLARVNQQDVFGRTAIMCAARRGSRRCVEILLHHGTDITIQDNWGVTVVYYAAFATYPAMLRSILQRRISNVNIKDRSAAHHCVLLRFVDQQKTSSSCSVLARIVRSRITRAGQH